MTASKKNREKTFRFSPRGFSLIEVLASLTIVTGLVIASSLYSKMVVVPSVTGGTDRFACIAHGNAVIQKLRAHAGVVAIHPFFATVAVPLPASGPARFHYPTLFPVSGNNSQLWNLGTSVPPIVAATPPPSPPGKSAATVGNSIMIAGPMRAFNAYYNMSSPDFCGGFNSNAELDALVSTTSIVLDHGSGVPVSRMRVRLFDLGTGAVISSCAKPVWIYPKGVSDGSLDAFQVNYDGGSVASRPVGTQNYRNDRGILIEIETMFTSKSGETGTCVVGQRFSHDAIRSRPPQPSVEVTIQGYGASQPSASPAPGSDNNRSTATLRVVQSAAGSPSTVVLCRDRSELLAPGPFKCFVQSTAPGIGPGPQFYPNTYFNATSLAVPDYMKSSTPAPTESTAPVPQASPQTSSVWPGPVATPQPAFLSSNPWGVSHRIWKPCETVTICGRPPSGTPTPAIAGSTITYTNTYSGLPSGCVVRIEAAAIDTAGNLSGSDPFFPAQITSSGTSISGLTTPRPSCNYFCRHHTQPMQSYWKMTPCCVGASCNPTTPPGVPGFIESVNAAP